MRTPIAITVSHLIDFKSCMEIIRYKSDRRLYPGLIVDFDYRGKHKRAEVEEIGQTVLVREVQ